MPNNAPELKPCPFCDNKARLAMSVDEKISSSHMFIGDFTTFIPTEPKGMRAWRVICNGCECWGPVSIVRIQAIESWNTRKGEKG